MGRSRGQSATISKVVQSGGWNVANEVGAWCAFASCGVMYDFETGIV